MRGGKEDENARGRCISKCGRFYFSGPVKNSFLLIFLVVTVLHPLIIPLCPAASTSFSTSNSFKSSVNSHSYSPSNLNGPIFLDKFSDQILEPGPGVSLSLRCTASGNPLPQVTWLLDGKAIPDHLRFRTGDYVTRDSVVVSYVNITSVTPQDGGLYECTASNEIAQIKHSANLRIFGPPHIRSMENSSAVSGESFALHCPVTGHPVEKIFWEKDKQRLPFNHRQKVFPNGTLHLVEVDRILDEGSYTCFALAPGSDGKNGAASSTLHLSVQMKPVIEPFTFSKTLQEGQRYNVLCSVTRGDSPLTIKWFKDGRVLNSPSNHQSSNIISPEYLDINVVRITEYSSTLIFESLRPDHSGNYTCQASNRAGSVAVTQSMIVHVPPKWIIEPNDSSVLSGTTAVINCQADGFPQPTVHWSKREGPSESSEFKPVISGSHLQVFQNGSLAIHLVQRSDAASYLCQVSNGIGTGLSKVIRLAVNIPAHFKSKFRAETVRKGHEAVIKCESEGDRPLAISWTKDKNPLKIKDDSRYELTESFTRDGLSAKIVIKNADRRDSALFTCITTNPFGGDETNIQMIMQEPPDPPQDVKATKVDGRSAVISWSPPYSGNSPILNYIIQHRPDQSTSSNLLSTSLATSTVNGNDLSSPFVEQELATVPSLGTNYINTTVSGIESSALIRNLKPVSSYEVRVFAINGLGKSEGSQITKFVTDEEAPGGAPLNVKSVALSSKSIRVSWKPPRLDLQYGIIKGYYVGYRVFNSEADSFIYKTLEIDSPEFTESTILYSLKRFTKYTITVQAFNSKGTGPPSEVIEMQTLQNDPPAVPILKVVSVTTSAINLTWTVPLDSANSQPPSDSFVAVNGFILHAKKQDSNHEWEEVRLPGDQWSYTFDRLACGSRYQYYLEAFNEVGKSDPSEIVTTKTEGSPPVAPDRESFISSNTSTATLYLDSWHDGSCPISSFEIAYKPKKLRGKSEMIKILPAETKVALLKDLLPSTVYEVKVIAINEVSATESTFNFTTSSLMRPSSINTEASVSFTPSWYLEASLILPATISIIMVMLFIFIIRIWMLKKRQSSGSNGGSGNFYGPVYGLSDMGSTNCAMKKITGSVTCVNSGGCRSGDGLCDSSSGFSPNDSNNGNELGIQSSLGDCGVDSSVLCYTSPYEMAKLANGYKSATLGPSSHLTSNTLKSHQRIHSSINSSYSEVNKLVNMNGDLVGHSNDLSVHLSPLKGQTIAHCCSNGEPMYATVKRTPRAPRNNTNGDANDTCHVYQYPLPISSLIHTNNHHHHHHHHQTFGNGNSVTGSESCCGDTQSCNSFASTTNGTIDAPTSAPFFRNEDSNDKINRVHLELGSKMNA